MDKRKDLILNTIIKEHIKTGSPVGSSVLVEKYKLNISPATARNEMAALEDDDYIRQPHISAGRVPTEKAYRRYVENIKDAELGKPETSRLEDILKKQDESAFKEVAKTLSHLTGNAVFLAFHRHNLYYTGISNLFQQPEFSQLNIIYDISAVIDRIDEIIDDMFSRVSQGVNIFLGSENPFGDFCGTSLIKYRFNGQDGLIGILGPMRMDYKKNLALLKYLDNKFSNL